MQPAFKAYSEIGTGFEYGSEWPSIVDIILSVLLIVLLFVVLQLIRLAEVPERLLVAQLQTDFKKSFLAEFHDTNIRFKEEGNIQYFSLQDKVLFAFGSTEITPNGVQVVQKVGEFISTHQDNLIQIEVIGHTDPAPVSPNVNYRNNLELSALRSAAAVSVLQKQGLLDMKKISAVGRSYFESDGFESFNEMRRIEFRLIYGTD